MRSSFLRFALCCLCLLCLGVWRPSHAFSRVELPMGDYVRASPLIVIGDITFSPAPQRMLIVSVREVVKGDAEVGESIPILREGTTRYIVPREVKNAAVFFTSEAESSSPIEQVYQKPDELTAVRALVDIYKLPTEREQLVALEKRAQDDNSLFDTQLVADFARMRQPQNFDVVLASFETLDTKRQGDLVDLLGRIGDERALPLLLRALQSPQREVRAKADHSLTYYFPGAPGVTEAFHALAQDPGSRDLALPYLAAHDPAFAATLPRNPPTPWQQAKTKLEAKDVAAGREMLFGIIEGEKGLTWSALFAAQELLPLLDAAGKERLRLLIVKGQENGDSDYLRAKSTADLLRSLPNKDNTAALIHLMYEPTDAPYVPWGEAARTATFALVQLGPAAKQSGAETVVAKIKSRLVPGVQTNFGEESLYACQLAWLADDATWQKAMVELPPNFAEQMKELQPVRDAATSQNEAAALAALLPAPPNRWQGDTIRWIIARLGLLGAPVAVGPLLGELEISRLFGISSDIEAALIAIGGPQVEEGALKLLSSEHDDVRRSGMDILRALQGEKMRPLLRRMLTEPRFGDRNYALFLLGYVGTPDDLPLLLPFADFWKGDRALQNNATSAIVGIRERFGYDVNGPIAKVGTTQA